MKKMLIVCILFGQIFAADFPANNGNVLSASGGRFVMGQISTMRRDQYLLDTKTGRLWVVVKGENGVSMSPIQFRNLFWDTKKKKFSSFFDNKPLN